MAGGPCQPSCVRVSQTLTKLTLPGSHNIVGSCLYSSKSLTDRDGDTAWGSTDSIRIVATPSNDQRSFLFPPGPCQQFWQPWQHQITPMKCMACCIIGTSWFCRGPLVATTFSRLAFKPCILHAAPAPCTRFTCVFAKTNHSLLLQVLTAMVTLMLD
jgi:hypothetical protein